MFSKLRRFFGVVRVLASQFKEFLITFAIVFAVSISIFHNFYPKELTCDHQKLTWLESAYDTWQMIFFESPLQFTNDWRVAPLFFILPVVGLLVIAEGVVRMGNLLFHYKQYSREWQNMVAQTYDDHMLVCGLGNVGFRVVEHLIRYGEKVIAIEHNPDSRFVAEMQGFNVPVIIGDVRDVSLLERLNIKSAKALLAVTDNDLVNIEAALTARDLAPGIRVVVRLFDQRLAQKVSRTLGFQSAFSASALAATTFAQSAIYGDILDSFEFGNVVVNAVRLVAGQSGKLMGRTVEQIQKEMDINVLVLERKEQVIWNPDCETVIVEGDVLLIVTDPEGFKRLDSAGCLTKNGSNGHNGSNSVGLNIF